MNASELNFIRSEVARQAEERRRARVTACIESVMLILAGIAALALASKGQEIFRFLMFVAR